MLTCPLRFRQQEFHHLLHLLPPGVVETCRASVSTLGVNDLSDLMPVELTGFRVEDPDDDHLEAADEIPAQDVSEKHHVEFQVRCFFCWVRYVLACRFFIFFGCCCCCCCR